MKWSFALEVERGQVLLTLAGDRKASRIMSKIPRTASYVVKRPEHKIFLNGTGNTWLSIFQGWISLYTHDWKEVWLILLVNHVHLTVVMDASPHCGSDQVSLIAMTFKTWLSTLEVQWMPRLHHVRVFISPSPFGDHKRSFENKLKRSSLLPINIVYHQAHSFIEVWLIAFLSADEYDRWTLWLAMGIHVIGIKLIRKSEKWEFAVSAHE